MVMAFCLLFLTNTSDVASEQAGAQAVGVHQHTFCSNLKRVFKQDLNQNMFKNGYFLKSPRRREIRLQIPACLRRLGAWPSDSRVVTPA